MGFIIKVLKSKDPTIEIFYDLIIIVINKLTKCFHFILFTEIFSAKQLKHFFIN